MPVLTQLNLNIGTEQNPNMVLHDLHDIRISSTDVNTVTRLLGCDAGVNSIAPLTLDNAASLLGDLIPKDLNASDDIENLKAGFYRLVGTKPIGFPSGVGLYGYMIIRGRDSFRQLYYSSTSGDIVTAHSFTGSSSGNIANWYKFEGTLVTG